MKDNTRFWGIHVITTVIMAICLIWIIALLAFGKSISLYEQKTRLEIEKLKYELDIYKESKEMEE